ncbi:hypothetical protein BT96DRAFT_568596 [Gymnopus androsaceus JB14]|uniref:Uncharacterized protein n=1 Tax=Gymnopus androsaceus JB14 TaxID=1447944 RepID=A0A6A4GKB4_9AGAR|nr:hypothetical protein BT96DRAFT_568596 [Gymnopus androsaceus JB14]
MSSRYVKGYAIDWAKIAQVLELEYNEENIDRIQGGVFNILQFVRRESHACRNTHSFCTARPLTPKTSKSVVVISGGLESFGLDLEELKNKSFQYPDYMVSLAEHFLEGPDVFEIVDYEDPLISVPDSSLTLASSLGFH